MQTYNKSPYFEEQMGFGSNGVDQRWELVACGTNATITAEQPVDVKDPNSSNQP